MAKSPSEITWILPTDFHASDLVFQMTAQQMLSPDIMTGLNVSNMRSFLLPFLCRKIAMDLIFFLYFFFKEQAVISPYKVTHFKCLRSNYVHLWAQCYLMHYNVSQHLIVI